MSGDASTRIQLAPSALMATDDWVRAWALSRPLRSPSQLRQLQFHCGNPPPAAEPRTCTLTVHGQHATHPANAASEARCRPSNRGRLCRPRDTSSSQNVHRDFEAETEIDKFGFGPDHRALHGWLNKTRMPTRGSTDTLP